MSIRKEQPLKLREMFNINNIKLMIKYVKSIDAPNYLLRIYSQYYFIPKINITFN